MTLSLSNVPTISSKLYLTGRPFLHLPDEEDKDSAATPGSADGVDRDEEDADGDDGSDAALDDGDGKESSIRTYEASGLSTVAESVALGVDDEDEEEEMDLDQAWEVMQLPEVVTSEEMLSVTGKTKPIVPLYSHVWGGGGGAGGGILMEEEEEEGEEEEGRGADVADDSASEVGFLASWAAAYPKSDIPHSHRGFNRLHHFCTASRDVELPKSLRGVARLHHTPARIDRQQNASDAEAVVLAQRMRQQLQQQQRPNTRVVKSAGGSALARRQSWAARRILKEVDDDDDELDEAREGEGGDDDDPFTVHESSRASTPEGDGRGRSRASSVSSTSSSRNNLTLDGMLKTWQFRAKRVFDPSGIAVLGAKPFSIGKTDARMFWNLAPPRMDVRPDVVKQV